jgi:hypothetical protein
MQLNIFAGLERKMKLFKNLKKAQWYLNKLIEKEKKNG